MTAIATIASATATADPAPETIGYTLRLVDKSVTLTVDAGSLTAGDGQLQLKDRTGAPVTSLPLTYQRGGAIWPIAAAIDGSTVTLTPDTAPDHAKPAQGPAPDLREIAIDPQSTAFNTALMNFSTQAGLGVSLGALIGTAIGATVGCVAGGLAVGAAAAVPTIGTLAIPGFLGGCLVTAAALGAIGAVVGTVVVGIPVAATGALLFLDALGKQATS
ncbi:hypothetical protein [Nocardia sp. NPDC052566]|uniref:hypothetical protein n=1 Tax=Nocardia sp. NPDC052566 TaxID=3364330 RepID=UPI0037CA16AD